MIGAIHVPVFTSLSSDEYRHIVNHSEAKFIFVSDRSLYNVVRLAIGQKIADEIIYSFDEIQNVRNLKEIINEGEQVAEKYKDELEQIKNSITEEDFLTLIYTSGTTGESKGVMLSHKNLVQNFLAAADIFKMGPQDKYLSILPLCHVGGRLGNYQTQYSGSSLYYAENMGTIASNMKELKPMGFDAVPRILEKVYDNVIAQGKKLKGIKKTIFFWAVDLGLKYKQESRSSWWYKQRLKIADKLIFSKWRDALGGNVRLVGCGGAALQPRLERIFWACGIKVLNMYGLTETSPIITINRQDDPDLKLGTVGALIKGVELKIAEDGEILCKGHNVMIGYYKNKELTGQAIDSDGWFHTGDVGYMDEGRFLVITDRKKEIFKLSSGKFIAPQKLENKIKESQCVDQVMVVGESEKFASAIISPNIPFIKEWCEKNNHVFTSKEEIVQKPEMYALIQEDIKQFNKSFSKAERILRFKLVLDEWSPNTGELSPTLKLRRRYITEKYKVLIDQIYGKQTVE
ncbi:MAG: long-chain fatty acid--CoA ligase [Prolixibacteraceae bacterium]|nr:long-chain fatty acid--CoA ligase [Prolixibacteraceae bacterium]